MTPHLEISRDFGTSRWQLRIELYTDFPCVRKRLDRPLLARVGPRRAASAWVRLSEHCGQALQHRRCLSSGKRTKMRIQWQMATGPLRRPQAGGKPEAAAPRHFSAPGATLWSGRESAKVFLLAPRDGWECGGRKRPDGWLHRSLQGRRPYSRRCFAITALGRSASVRRTPECWTPPP
jgi:hypothetical protein